MNYSEFIMVCDEYGNCLYDGNSTDDCQEWCYYNGINGSNGEYIALGYLDEWNSFHLEDIEEIDNYKLYLQELSSNGN